MDLIIKHEVPSEEIGKVEKKFKTHWKMAQIEKAISDYMLHKAQKAGSVII